MRGEVAEKRATKIFRRKNRRNLRHRVGKSCRDGAVVEGAAREGWQKEGAEGVGSHAKMMRGRRREEGPVDEPGEAKSERRAP